MSSPTTPAQAQKDYPTAQDFANFLNQHWPNQRVNDSSLPGNTVGDQWTAWYKTESAKHPSYSLGQWEITFFDFVAVRTLGTGLEKAIGGTGTAVGQIEKGTAQGAAQVASQFAPFLTPLEDISTIFHALGEASTWIRLAKIVIGGTLIIVGVSHLMGVENKITDIAKKVPIVPV